VSEPIVFISHFKVKEGKLDSLKQLHQRVVEQIKADKPGTLVFLHYLNEEGTEYSVIHVFPDADSFDRHGEGAAERAKNAFEFIELTRREIYGVPSEHGLAVLRPTDGSGITFNAMPQFIGGYIRYTSR
jgi:quinol monooxygenase YgiN